MRLPKLFRAHKGPKGRHGVLRYIYGDKVAHLVLPTGQHLREDQSRRDHSISGKRRRHDRIKARREAREAVAAMPPP